MRVLSVGSGLGVLLVCAVLHGRWTNRWGTTPELREGVARLAQVPRVLGDWDGADAELAGGDLQAAGGDGSLCRRYTNRRDGRTALVFLLCGRPGPVSVHTPDVCYRGAGYEVAGPPVPQSVEFGGAAPAAFKRIKVRPAGLKAGDPFQVYWSWGAAGSWQAPASPRLAFARQPVLFKLYVIVPAETDGGTAGDAAVADFIRQFLPEVQKALFPDVGPAPGGKT